jgi:hypothetical protein
MLASASPRKPNVEREQRSWYEVIFEVVKRSQRMGKSSFWMIAERRKRWRFQNGFGPRERDKRTDTNTLAVVDDDDALGAAVLDGDPYARACGIERVLEQFLDHAYRPLDYFALRIDRALA